MLLSFNFLTFFDIIRKILTFNLPCLFYKSNQRVIENRTRTKLTQVIFGSLRVDRVKSYKYSGTVREIQREIESLYRVTILKAENKSTQSEINKSKPEARWIMNEKRRDAARLKPADKLE